MFFSAFLPTLFFSLLMGPAVDNIQASYVLKYQPFFFLGTERQTYSGFRWVPIQAAGLLAMFFKGKYDKGVQGGRIDLLHLWALTWTKRLLVRISTTLVMLTACLGNYKCLMPFF